MVIATSVGMPVEEVTFPAIEWLAPAAPKSATTRQSGIDRKMRDRGPCPSFEASIAHAQCIESVERRHLEEQPASGKARRVLLVEGEAGRSAAVGGREGNTPSASCVRATDMVVGPTGKIYIVVVAHARRGSRTPAQLPAANDVQPNRLRRRAEEDG